VLQATSHLESSCSCNSPLPRNMATMAVRSLLALLCIFLLAFPYANAQGEKPLGLGGGNQVMFTSPTTPCSAPKAIWPSHWAPKPQWPLS
jgi:hypothetical protein